MATKQNMMQTITQAATESTKAAVIAVKEVENAVNTARSVQVMPRTVSPALKQPSLDWKATNNKNYEALG